MKLTPRLEAIAHLVLPGQPMADIGSDHAYLPLYLVKGEIVPYAIAVEVRQGPWAKAERLIRLHDLAGKIEVRLGDGLQPLQPGEIATAVLAGMGAQTIIEVLSVAELVLQSLQRLVIQPMVEVALVREWLYSHDWHLIDEELVQEGERYYVVLVAEPGAESLPPKISLELGPKLLAKKHPLLKPYINKLINKNRQILEALERAKSEKAFKHQRELQNKIAAMEEVMRWLSCAKT